jgi:hypothetical protein
MHQLLDSSSSDDDDELILAAALIAQHQYDIDNAPRRRGGSVRRFVFRTFVLFAFVVARFHWFILLLLASLK